MLRRQLSRHANQKRLRGRRGRELDLLPLQSVPITTKAVSSNPTLISSTLYGLV
jgi:hypothetical protein